MNKKETIIVLGAHSDDFVIGAGGTIAKYAQDGKKVISIVFSYGENSHPWLKQRIVQQMRSDETIEASKILNCKSYFYDLKEYKFLDEFKEKKLDKKLLALFNKEKPTKMFTHSFEDPHPDHRAVHKITLDLFNKLDQKPELYIYSIWNPISLKTKYPSLCIDTTKTFFLKLKALRTFRSQFVHVAYPFILLLIRDIKEGIGIKKRFAERFFRIR